MSNPCTTDINSDACFTYCSSDINRCLPTLLSQCFNMITPFDSKIFRSYNCYAPLQYYFSTSSNTSVADTKLIDFCGKIPGLNASTYLNYTNGSEPNLDNRIRDICACHLPASVYTNFGSSLLNEVSFLQGVNPKCYFPGCGAVNLYKPSDMTGCPSTNCLNFSSITGTGVINGPISVSATGVCEGFDTRNTCMSDSQCSASEKCYRNKCIPKNTCRTNGDCGTGSQKCYQNVCIPSYYCTPEMPLESSYKCYQGQIKEKSYCQVDGDCTNGLTCKNNICTSYNTTSNTIMDYIWWIVGGVGLLLGVLLIIGIIVYNKRKK